MAIQRPIDPIIVRWHPRWNSFFVSNFSRNGIYKGQLCSNLKNQRINANFHALCASKIIVLALTVLLSMCVIAALIYSQSLSLSLHSVKLVMNTVEFKCYIIMVWILGYSKGVELFLSLPQIRESNLEESRRCRDLIDVLNDQIKTGDFTHLKLKKYDTHKDIVIIS